MSDFEPKRVSEIANPAPEGDATARSHERHTLADPQIAHLEFSPELQGTIKNLSYGGISVEFPRERANLLQEFFSDTDATFQASLMLAHKNLRTKLSLVRLIGRKAAFTFVHDSAEILVFLREALEPMRIGTTMKPIHGFKGEEWKDMRFTLRGDAHSELDIMINSNGELMYSRLTFTNQGYIFEVTFKDKKIHTGVAVVNFGSAAQTKNTKQLDLKLLRQSVFILMGFDNEVISDQKTELTNEIMQSLNALLPASEPAA
jgi:hypothetical protein